MLPRTFFALAPWHFQVECIQAFLQNIFWGYDRRESLVHIYQLHLIEDLRKKKAGMGIRQWKKSKSGSSLGLISVISPQFLIPGKFALSNWLAKLSNSDMPITSKLIPERFKPNEAPPYPANPSNTRSGVFLWSINVNHGYRIRCGWCGGTIARGLWVAPIEQNARRLLSTN